MRSNLGAPGLALKPLIIVAKLCYKQDMQNFHVGCIHFLESSTWLIKERGRTAHLSRLNTSPWEGNIRCKAVILQSSSCRTADHVRSGIIAADVDKGKLDLFALHDFTHTHDRTSHALSLALFCPMHSSRSQLYGQTQHGGNAHTLCTNASHFQLLCFTEDKHTQASQQLKWSDLDHIIVVSGSKPMSRKAAIHLCTATTAP